MSPLPPNPDAFDFYDVESLLGSAAVPSRDKQIAAIQANLPIIADELIASDPMYLQLSDPVKFERVCSRILEHWSTLHEMAGMLVFVFSMIMLLIVSSVLQWKKLSVDTI